MLQVCEEVILLRELQSPFVENLAAQLSYLAQVYIVIVIYSPPRVHKVVFVENFELFLGSLGCYNCPMIVFDDLTLDTLKSNMLLGEVIRHNSGQWMYDIE